MMNPLFGMLSFLHPWILTGLLALPALWLLLRVTPPPPRLMRFPAARFLDGLSPRARSAQRTPWWILLLRLLIAALIIIAMAQPLWNPAAMLKGTGPVRIVMDNGWAAAQTWPTQSEAAQNIIDRAGRENRDIYILTTAPEPGKTAPLQQGPLAQGKASTILKGLKPHPWPADYDEAARLVRENGGSFQSYLLAHGLRDGDEKGLSNALKAQGDVSIMVPASNRLPLLLRFSQTMGIYPSVLVDFLPETARNLPVSIEILARDGHVVDVQKATLSNAQRPLRLTFELPEALRQQAARIHITGRAGAGGVLLLDQSFKRHSVGIVNTGSNAESNTPLVEASFYLQRALEPFADVGLGDVDKLLDANPSVMLLPDIGALPPLQLNRLEDWVRKGGLLLRFAGPHMTQGDSFLTPVPIMKGGRALDGSLTWEKPQTLIPFSETSPYYGLDIPEDLTINRQLLAQPVEGLEKMTWATLQDGTPLVTATTLDKGLLVLVHTTATPEWSNLSLSGLFVQILKRTINLAGNPAALAPATGSLQPLLVMDGFGNLVQPDGSAAPIPAENFAMTKVSSLNPPGFYGRHGVQEALNLSPSVPALLSWEGLDVVTYGKSKEKELLPYLLSLAFILFLIDWIIMIMLQSGLRNNIRTRRRVVASLLVAGLLLMTQPAQATTNAEAVKYASGLYIAYVKTGNPNIDALSYKGLENLSLVLRQRTSVEPAGIVPVDPEGDDMAFFPLIYWPVQEGQPPLSDTALRNVQSYLDHGGTIIFDTRDKGRTGQNATLLRTAIGGLNIPPLIAIPPDHVLAKSFYLMKNFPEQYNAGNLWIEENSATGRDGVSSVIITNHDWAKNWASNQGRDGMDQEMALRFGVNLIMYALTGNYKADQVHLQSIIERLGP